MILCRTMKGNLVVKQLTWVVIVFLLIGLGRVAVVSANETTADTVPPHLRLIEGQPLTITVTNDGRYQMTYNDVHNFPAHASGALYLWYNGCEFVPQTTPLSGPSLAAWVPLVQSQVAGDGSSALPWRVSTRMQATCEQGLEAQELFVESVASYTNTANFFLLDIAVCGGQAGQQVETALLTQSENSAYLRADARSAAVFDQSGCADFDILWNFGAPPETPLALELVSFGTTSNTDLTTIAGFALVGFVFLASVSLWLLMMRPGKRRRQQLMDH